MKREPPWLRADEENALEQFGKKRAILFSSQLQSDIWITHLYSWKKKKKKERKRIKWTSFVNFISLLDSNRGRESTENENRIV